VKGKGYWLWIVRCRESNHVIAWHISKGRFLKDARAVLRKAMEQTRGVRPKKIITDGLWQYPVAIKKEVGWNWRKLKKQHVVDSGIGKNWFIERLNREIKRRIRWFSTFQALSGAKAFFGLWFYHHNE
jgi:transposase-like protein